MYLSIIFLPLLGSIVSGFFGRKVGVRGAQLITCSSVIVTIYVFNILSRFKSYLCLNQIGCYGNDVKYNSHLISKG